MRIKNLHLKNFRGFAEREFRFHENLTVVVGENGSGKTSLLEALSVALGGWLCGFDSLEGEDRRNLTAADCRATIAEVNAALVEQFPVEVKCEATLQTDENVEWTRVFLNAQVQSSFSADNKIHDISKAYNGKIYSAEDEDIILPLVAYYSTARLGSEPIRMEQKATRDKIRLHGYKQALTFSNSISDTANFIDRLAYFAYRADDKRDLAKMNAIISSLETSLESVLPSVNVYYDMRLAEFCVKDVA
jgi:predicted ATP-binding protein involved in virulence